MPFNAGAIVSKMLLDVAGYKHSVAEVQQGGDKIEAAMQDASAAARKVGTAFIAIGAAVSAGLGMIVREAMNFQESANLYRVSMGEMEASTTKWVNTLNDSLGISREVLMRSVGTFQAMLTGMGIAADQAAKMSTTFTKLQLDLASFYNLNIEDAFLKLQSAISGEVEPMRRLGVSVDELTVKTWAYKNGLVEQGKELTQQEKIIGRYNVVMEATMLAQGDMERTQRQLANQVKFAGQRIKDLAVDLGSHLLPAAEQVFQKINDLLKTMKAFVRENDVLAAGLMATSAAFGATTFAAGSLLIAFSMLKSSAISTGVALKVLAAKTALATGGLSLAVGAITMYVLHAAKMRKEMEQGRQKFSAVVDELILAEGKYKALAFRQDSTGASAQGLAVVTKELADIYNDLGVAVDKTSESFGDMTQKIMEQRAESLGLIAVRYGQQIMGIQNRIVAAQRELDAIPKDSRYLEEVVKRRDLQFKITGLTKTLTNAVKYQTDAYKELATIRQKLVEIINAEIAAEAGRDEDAEYEAKRLLSSAIGGLTAEIEGQIEALRAAAEVINLDARETRLLGDAIDDLQDKLGKLKDVTGEQAEAFKRAGITTTAAINDQIAAMEALIPAAQGDAFALRQIEDALARLHKQLRGVIEEYTTLKDLGIQTDQELMKQIVVLTALRDANAGNERITGELTERIKALKKELFGEENMEEKGIIAGMKKGWAEFEEQIADTTETARAAVMSLAESVRTGLGSALADMVTGVKSSKEAWKDFAHEVIRNLIRVATQLLINIALTKALARAGSGGGEQKTDWVAIGLRVAGGVAGAAGGGGGGTFTNLPSGRHSGKLIPRERPGGDSEKPTFVIKNLITSETVASAMAANPGKNVIVNTIRADAQRRGPTHAMMQEMA